MWSGKVRESLGEVKKGGGWESEEKGGWVWRVPRTEWSRKHDFRKRNTKI